MLYPSIVVVVAGLISLSCVNDTPKKTIREYQTHGVVFFDLSENTQTVSPDNDQPRVVNAQDSPDRKLVTKNIDLANPQVKQLAQFSDVIKKYQQVWLKEFLGIEKLSQPQGTKDLLSRISVPDITVEVRKPDYKTTVASALTDLHGHYRIPEVPEGRYALCWKGLGWKEACFSKLISIQDNTFYSDIIYIKPAKQTAKIAPLTGKVKMVDGQLCRHLDIQNSVNLTASVQLNDKKAPLATVHTNSMGQYVFPLAPRNSKVSVAAYCPDVQAEKIKIALQSQAKRISGGQMLVTGDINLFSGIKAASSKVSVGQQKRQDLTLLGKKPNIVGFGAKDASGKYVTKALAGETIQLI
ncbi:MAG: carboxypeptidase-like regulatory domain-containing protein [Pseudomonadales bacterium]